MFKRLFGNKKSNPESLEEAKNTLLENIKEETLNKKIGQSLESCIDLLKDATTEEIEDMKQSVFELTETSSAGQTSRAFSVYSTLLERVHITDEDIDRAIHLYSSHLNNALPFFGKLIAEVKKGEEAEEYYATDIDELYKQLISDRSETPEDVAKSVVLTDALTQSLISIVSVDVAYINRAKDALLQQVKQIKDYNQSGYWLSRLFSILFNEPIVAIDVDNHIGFEGKVSGVSDNYQLHLLLMGMPELNPIPAISEQELSVANGTGIHMSNAIINYKWNMYNYEVVDQEDWEDIKIGPAKTHELQDFWIWGEASLHEISTHNGKRVVLLGRSPIKRSSKLQRMFKNVRAGIEVEKVLSEEEINEWLKLNN